MGVIEKLERVANDPSATPAERESYGQKAAELRKKYGTVNRDVKRDAPWHMFVPTPRTYSDNLNYSCTLNSYAYVCAVA